MSDDILDRAGEIADRYKLFFISSKSFANSGMVEQLSEFGKLGYDALEFMPELVADIKRHRDPANVLFRLEDKLEKISSDPLIVASVKRVDELQEQLADKDAEITSWIADRDRWIARYEAVRKEKDARIAELEAIAIEESAKYLAASHCASLLVHPKAIEGTMLMIKDHVSVFREQAAKELNLQMSQETSYRKRLEKDYLAWVYEYYSDLGEETAIREAQAALDKIKGEKERD